MTTAIVDGGRVNTEPELEFAELVERPKLSPAEILGNLHSWLTVDASIEAFDKKKVRNATDLEAAMIRREALKEVLGYLERLNAIDFVA